MQQQLDHWARLGRAVSMHDTSARRHVEAVLAGTLPMSSATDAERLVVNAELDARIQHLAQTTSFGKRLAAEGVPTVALDANGILTEYQPDGSSAPLA